MRSISVLLIAGSTCRSEAAVQLLAFTSAHVRTFGYVNDVDPGLQAMTKTLRDELGDAGFETAYNLGLQLPLDQAVALALDVLDRAESSPSEAAISTSSTVSG